MLSNAREMSIEELHYFYIASHISILHQLCAFEMRNLISELNNSRWKCFFPFFILRSLFYSPSLCFPKRFEECSIAMEETLCNFWNTFDFTYETGILFCRRKLLWRRVLSFSCERSWENEILCTLPVAQHESFRLRKYSCFASVGSSWNRVKYSWLLLESRLVLKIKIHVNPTRPLQSPNIQSWLIEWCKSF